MGWNSFVAVGDSFTEGVGDPYDDGRGYRGWADLVAARLAVEFGPDFRYANLAIRGRLFDQVVAEQVPPTLTMRPDLISFAAGGNDALRRGFDHDVLLDRFDRAVARLRGTGADVLLFGWTDISRRLPAGRVIGGRIRLINQAVADTGARHGARVIDLWHDSEFFNPRLWAADRLHLSAYGHRRVAAHVLSALGIEAEDAWLAAVPAPKAASWLGARAADVRWAGQHLAPWVKRRLTGRSSGDLVQPKRPMLAPLLNLD